MTDRFLVASITEQWARNGVEISFILEQEGSSYFLSAEPAASEDFCRKFDCLAQYYELAKFCNDFGTKEFADLDSVNDAISEHLPNEFRFRALPDGDIKGW